jgi:hypothetical protein
MDINEQRRQAEYDRSATLLSYQTLKIPRRGLSARSQHSTDGGTTGRRNCSGLKWQRAVATSQ